MSLRYAETPDGVRKTYRHDHEKQIAQAYADIELASLDLVYTEAKSTISEQLKSVDVVGARATWLVATAAGIALAVVSQWKNIGELNPSPVVVRGLAYGVFLEALARALGLRAALLQGYQSGLHIEDLRREYADWELKHAKLSLLRKWQTIFEYNEKLIEYRANVIATGVGLLLSGLLFIGFSCLFLIWGRLW